MNVFESLNGKQQELIIKHLDLVIKANETTNLTRIDDKEEAMILHVEDSLAGLEDINNSPSGLYGDLGSGAGFPGIPLSIVTGRKTFLIDSRKKKMDVVQGMIEELDLQGQIYTYAGRAELLARSHKNEYAVLTARALSSLPVLMELASPLLFQGGRLICYKATVETSEREQAMRAQDATGMSFLYERKFELEGDVKRSIIVFEKSKKPKMKLPRIEGEAQRNPLGA